MPTHFLHPHHTFHPSHLQACRHLPPGHFYFNQPKLKTPQTELTLTPHHKPASRTVFPTSGTVNSTHSLIKGKTYIFILGLMFGHPINHWLLQFRACVALKSGHVLQTWLLRPAWLRPACLKDYRKRNNRVLSASHVVTHWFPRLRSMIARPIVHTEQPTEEQADVGIRHGRAETCIQAGPHTPMLPLHHLSA